MPLLQRRGSARQDRLLELSVRHNHNVSSSSSHVSLIYHGDALLYVVRRYAYESTVIDRSPFVTARREMVEAGEWVEQSTGVWVRNETVLKRHGIAFTFSQEGLVGATNLNTLAVHLISIKGMIGVVVRSRSQLCAGLHHQASLCAPIPEIIRTLTFELANILCTATGDFGDVAGKEGVQIRQQSFHRQDGGNISRLCCVDCSSCLSELFEMVSSRAPLSLGLICVCIVRLIGPKNKSKAGRGLQRCASSETSSSP